MPRVKRRGHKQRNTEAPLSEWTLPELQSELDRLEEEPGDLNLWAAFKRKSEIGNEIGKKRRSYESRK